jgi:hypothetical protein
MILSISVYSVFSLVKPAHATDVPDFNLCPNPGALAPFIKRGTKPLSGESKGVFVGGATAICGSFSQSGDFMLGLSCAILIVVGAIVINRAPNQ